MAAISLPFRTALAVGLCAIVSLGAGCAREDGGARTAAKETSGSSAENAPMPAAGAETDPNGTFTAFVAVEAFDMRAKAERIVNENQGKTPGSAGYERIVTGVVSDPQNPTRVYFATSAFDAASGTDFVGIYGFDTRSLNWWRLFRNTYKQKDVTAPALLRVIAYDGGRMFVVEDRVGASYPAGTIAKDVGKILAFDFAHPEEGLFPLPDPPANVANLPL